MTRKNLSTAQVHRACNLTKARKELADYLKPPKRPKQSSRGGWAYLFNWSPFVIAESAVPDDLTRLAAKFVIGQIDTELMKLGITP